MKKQIALCLLLFLLLLFSTICYGQQYEFSHLDNTNGLSNNQVECIYKDSRGFMWFGTNMGLNRYDGNNFKVYKHNKKDAKSPPSNRFTAIQEDADGNLWLELDTYYAFYDWHTESFTHCIDSLLAKMRMPQSVSIIRIDDEKNIFAYYPLNGIYKYNQTTKQALEVVSAQKMASADKSQVVEMKIRGQYIWMLHQNGLVEQFDTKTGKFAIRNTFFNENLKTSTIKKSLFIDSDGDLWLYPALEDKGIAYLDIIRATNCHQHLLVSL